MKNSKKQNESLLFDEISRAGDLDFNYADIKSRVNLSPNEKASVFKEKRYRPRPQVLAVACSLLLVTVAFGFGSFMMSRREPLSEPDTTVNGETVLSPETQPQKLPNLYPNDVLLWQGEVYVRTDLTVMKDAVGEQLGQVVSESHSGSQQDLRDDPRVAIAEHLEDGTPFHQVTNAENYIAVHAEDGYVIYQRQLTPDTENP